MIASGIERVFNLVNRLVESGCIDAAPFLVLVFELLRKVACALLVGGDHQVHCAVGAAEPAHRVDPRCEAINDLAHVRPA